MKTVSDVLRDDGLKQVLANTPDGWKEGVVQAARHLLEGMNYVTGEDIRLYCEQKNIRPHHCNAWGGVVPLLVSLDYLKETDRTVKAKDPKAHSRRIRVWESTVFRPQA